MVLLLAMTIQVVCTPQRPSDAALVASTKAFLRAIDVSSPGDAQPVERFPGGRWILRFTKPQSNYTVVGYHSSPQVREVRWSATVPLPKPTGQWKIRTAAEARARLQNVAKRLLTGHHWTESEFVMPHKTSDNTAYRTWARYSITEHGYPLLSPPCDLSIFISPVDGVLRDLQFVNDVYPVDRPVVRITAKQAQSFARASVKGGPWEWGLVQLGYCRVRRSPQGRLCYRVSRYQPASPLYTSKSAMPPTFFDLVDAETGRIVYAKP